MQWSKSSSADERGASRKRNPILSFADTCLSFWQRLADDPVAVATLALALVTVAAIVVPLFVGWRTEVAHIRSARRQIVSLLDAIVELLEQQMREPAWLAGEGMNVIAERLLDEKLLKSLPAEVANSTTRACTMAHRVLCSSDLVAEARREQKFEHISDSARVAKNRIEAARSQVAALGARRT